MWLTSSSIGRKFIMSLTGAFLVLFVTFHVLMNGVALFWPAAYNDVCEFLGANWYALIGSLVLAGGFALHILYALWLTYENRRARGNDRYLVNARQPQVEWASKNMLVLGIVVVAFLVVHLIQFWAKMQLVEALHLESAIPPAAGTLFLQEAFRQPWTLIVYLIGFIALWFHLTHGFWSMFQSSGINNRTWMPRLRCLGNAWATIVCALFIIEAIVFTVAARNGTYADDPRNAKLYEQYQELRAEQAAEDGPFQSLEALEGPACDQACGACCEDACGEYEVVCVEAECVDCDGCSCTEAPCPGCVEAGACKCNPCECNPCNCAPATESQSTPF